jgi:hypothetical protein
MRVADFENIVRVLNAADVRYLVVGGIAVESAGRPKDLDDVAHLRMAEND